MPWYSRREDEQPLLVSRSLIFKSDMAGWSGGETLGHMQQIVGISCIPAHNYDAKRPLTELKVFGV